MLEHEAAGTGYDIVETALSCVVTRFKIRSAWDLPRFYILFRRIRAASEGIAGLITTLFLVENVRTFYTFSLWMDRDAILEFNGKVVDHIMSANWSMRRLERTELGTHLWSAQFRLSAVSPHNLNWEGVDIEPYIQRNRWWQKSRSQRGEEHAVG